MEKDALKRISREKLNELFHRIGGEEVLLKILSEFYQTMKDDLLIGYFFTNKNIEEIVLKQKEFLMKSFGVTTSYSGKSPALAHTKLPAILTGHFDRRLVILKDVLKRNGIDEASIKLWLDFESTFKNAIVK